MGIFTEVFVGIGTGMTKVCHVEILGNQGHISLLFWNVSTYNHDLGI